jgi:hypothetical protein
LRDFPTFFTNDIRGALLFGSALETEHRGNGDNLCCLSTQQSDLPDRAAALDHPRRAQTGFS